jgi:HSP20 family protein
MDSVLTVDRPGRAAMQPSRDSSIDRIFEHFFSPKNLFSSIPNTLWSPPTDVYETPDAYVVRMEIPGIREDNISIELNHNVLTVRGRRNDHSTDTKLGFHQMEIHYGYFEKVVTLPHAIDPENRAGKYADGFLCITVGKSKPRRTRRHIQIES